MSATKSSALSAAVPRLSVNVARVGTWILATALVIGLTYAWHESLTAEDGDTAPALVSSPAVRNAQPQHHIEIAQASIANYHQELAALLNHYHTLDSHGDGAAVTAQRQQLLGKMQQVLSRWLRDDSEAAWQWLPDAGDLALPLGSALITATLERDVALASQYAESWGRYQPQWLQEIYAPLLAYLDAHQAYAQALELSVNASSETLARQQLVGQVMQHWANQAPELAARWAESQPAALRHLALTAINDTWSNQDPRAATLYAEHLEPGSLRDTLLQDAISRWLSLDESAATHWLRTELSSVSGQVSLDSSLYGYAISDDLLQRDPAAAMSWSQRIQDTELRWQAVQQIASSLKDRDPKHAADWIGRLSALSGDQQQQLATLLSSRSPTSDEPPTM